MPYTVELRPAALRALESLSRAAQERLRGKNDALGGDPRPPGCVKMAGEDDLWRIRVGSYRVIYAIHDDVLLVLAVRIGHRREVYRRR
ncbi:MAG: type II toxin-antitoxin system RelE/ParE family toxin [Deltaproteobacteria bacterium]|nr:type II toxin-antitoxin system RelE/ParE family toxin [Deltaproteobacteria bacterium]